jgi:hypothetical protein
MPAIVTSLATTTPADMPIWARLALIDKNVPFASVTHWQYEALGLIIAHVRTGLVFLVRS